MRTRLDVPLILLAAIGFWSGMILWAFVIDPRLGTAICIVAMIASVIALFSTYLERHP